MKKLIMYWWWGIAFGLMDESVPQQEMEDYHPDTRVTISNLKKKCEWFLKKTIPRFYARRVTSELLKRKSY